MAGQKFTTPSQPVGDNNFNGGLNSTSGPLSLQNNESSDLQNIDFNKFGSILKRNGYTCLNTSAISGSPSSDGLWWYEYLSAGSYASQLVNITNAKAYTMSGLSGTWTDSTGSTTITAGKTCDFENFLNCVYAANDNDPPFFWTGTGNFQKMPALVANTYTFKVAGVTVSPAAGDTYTNNAITYTVTYVNLVNGAGSILATGSGAPTNSGNLVRTAGAGDATIAFTTFYANVNITKAKCVVQYNNYLFLGNVTQGGIVSRSRIYWSNIKDDLSWLSTSFIDISKDDGQQIVNIYVMGDRLVVFKERSVYNVFFTGDADVPFVVQKSNSNVGCIAPFSIQDIENGLIFLSYDGFYYYDGNNSYKLSWNIQNTILSMNATRITQARSMKQRNKNRYFCCMPSTGQTNNDTIFVWDWFLNSWSIYKGMNPSAMTTVYNSVTDERIYFADYSGFVYRMDNGSDDYPLNVQTAISAYYYTNWKHFDDIVDQKGVPNVVVYYQTNNAILTLVCSYDFESADTYTQNFMTNTSSSVYGTAVYGTSTYAGIGGSQQRRDLDGRGRVIRLGFKNSNLSETFQIDGLGSFVHLETNV